jgi:hypothetical protein
VNKRSKTITNSLKKAAHYYCLYTDTGDLGNIIAEQAYSDDAILEIADLDVHTFSELLREALISTIPETFSSAHTTLQDYAGDIRAQRKQEENAAGLNVKKKKFVSLLSKELKQMYRELHR